MRKTDKDVTRTLEAGTKTFSFKADDIYAILHIRDGEAVAAEYGHVNEGCFESHYGEQHFACVCDSCIYTIMHNNIPEFTALYKSLSQDSIAMKFALSHITAMRSRVQAFSTRYNI